MLDVPAASQRAKEPLERPVISTPVFEIGITQFRPPSCRDNALQK